MQKTALCYRAAVVVQLNQRSYDHSFIGPPQLSRLLTKTLLVMKLTILFLVLGLLTANANGISQTVTFSGKKVKLTKVFDAIESQTGYTIFGNKDLLKGIKPVSYLQRICL